MTTQYHPEINRQEKGFYSSTKASWRFKTWVGFRNWTRKIVVALGILIGMVIIIQQNNTCQNELKPYTAIQLFLQIDDLGHQSINDTRKRWSIYDSWAWIAEWEIIDEKFHATNSISDKYELAKQMDVLMEKIDANIHKVWGLTTPEEIARDKTFHEVDSLFNQLK